MPLQHIGLLFALSYRGEMHEKLPIDHHFCHFVLSPYTLDGGNAMKFPIGQPIYPMKYITFHIT